MKIYGNNDDNSCVLQNWIFLPQRNTHSHMLACKQCCQLFSYLQKRKYLFCCDKISKNICVRTSKVLEAKLGNFVKKLPKLAILNLSVKRPHIGRHTDTIFHKNWCSWQKTMSQDWKEQEKEGIVQVQIRYIPKYFCKIQAFVTCCEEVLVNVCFKGAISIVKLKRFQLIKNDQV